MPTTKKLICVALSVALIVGLIPFIVHTQRLRKFGRIAASRVVDIDSISYRVVLRERCIDDLPEFILDCTFNEPGTDFEYWTEMEQAGQIVAVSGRENWDSARYDNPRIDSADSSGAIVTLDDKPRIDGANPSGATVFVDPPYRFNWLSQIHSSPNRPQRPRQ